MPPRLRSDIQVQALQRRAEGEGLVFTVLHHGHDEGGLIFIKWVEGRRARLFTERTVGDERRWVAKGPEADERDADQRLAKERDFDPDLWVVEIMGRFGAADALLDPADEA